jgi:hypothetical protein
MRQKGETEGGFRSSERGGYRILLLYRELFRILEETIVGNGRKYYKCEELSHMSGTIRCVRNYRICQELSYVSGIIVYVRNYRIC